MRDIRDKALAIEAYARQAKNTEAEQRACEIRLRAEQRAGQMLAEMDKAKGAQGTGSNQHQVRSQPVSTPKPLADLGISHNQSSRWQKLAAIPDADFEATFAKPGGAKQFTAGLIAAHQKTAAPEPTPKPVENPVDPRALWLWGRLLDFEREGILAVEWGRTSTPEAYVASMNLHRRHLTESQRSMVGARMATLPRGTNQHSGIPSSSPITRANVAGMLNVSVDSITDAKAVLRDGTPEEIKAVETGRVAVSTAASQVDEPTSM